MPTPELHVGYYQLISDTSLNFQLNRRLGYGSETLLADIRSVAPRLTTYPAWIAAFLDLAERALADGRRLNAAYHTRCAEFFMLPTDPRRGDCRERFIGLVIFRSRDWNCAGTAAKSALQKRALDAELVGAK